MALGFLNNNKLLGIKLSIRWCHGGHLDLSCLLIAKAQLVALHFGADDRFRWGQGNEERALCRTGHHAVGSSVDPLSSLSHYDAILFPLLAHEKNTYQRDNIGLMDLVRYPLGCFMLDRYPLQFGGALD